MYLFKNFWLCWAFVAACWLSLVSRSRVYSSCGAPALGAWASEVVARGLSSWGFWALEQGLNGCGAGSELL